MTTRGAIMTVLLCLRGAALAAVSGEPSKPFEPLPGDAAKRAEHECTGPQSWTQSVGGTVDGVICRDVVGYAAFSRVWQGNRSVSLANLGDTPIRNPRVVVNGQRDWGTTEAIVAEAVGRYERTADRARAVWEFQRRRRFHACTWDNEVHDVVKVFNVYGYTLCGNDATVLADLWTTAGVPTRRGWPVGHVVSEALYDGAWHLLDGDEHCLFLLRDNETIASEAEAVRDHDLIKRTHTYGILSGDNPLTDQFSASLYGYTGQRPPTRHRCPTRHTMDWTLYPGATITWRWGHAGKQYSGGAAVDQATKDGEGDLLAGWGPRAYALMCNGSLTWQPDLSTAAGRLGFTSTDHLAPPAPGAGLRLADAARPGGAVLRIASPYVMVGAAIELQAEKPGDGDAVEVSWSTDGKTFQTLGAATGNGPLTWRLDQDLSRRGQPCYAWWLRLGLRGGGAVTGLKIAADTQTSLLALPELEVGENRVEYRDDGDGPRRVKITQEWVERTAWQRPTAPAAAVSPADGAVVEGTKVKFAWRPAECPDGIGDYHFELSEHADLRWPLSPNFEKLIGLTAQKGTATYETPFVGLLNPGRTYYWHVRARSGKGAWGPWSATWSFRCEAPGVPLHVRLEPVDDGRRQRLVWAANPAGRPPVAYRVYAADEQGFSVSDEPYRVDFGFGFCRGQAEYEARTKDKSWNRYPTWPANLAAEVKATELVVAGPGLDLPLANKAFWRVAAVDEQGNVSGPSDFAELPRPWIWTAPVTAVKAGEEYRYQAQTVASIGHLTCPKSYTPAFWQKEYPTWKLTRAPDGLSIDATTGLVTGKLQAGQHEVAIEVTSPAGTARQEYRLTVNP